jgi:sulfide dehydrogenase cytochrome subunit
MNQVPHSYYPGLLLTTALISSSLAFGSHVQAEDMRGAILANPCAGCHGTDGMSSGTIPAIDDLEPEGIREELMKYKSGGKKGTIMNRIAKGYTDEEIDLIARHFGSLQK